MGKEIEHKYLVVSDSFKSLAKECHTISQGYLSKDPERIVRVRIKDDRGFLTVKGKTDKDSRAEYEYEIPVKDAEEMLPLCIGNFIQKRRWIVDFEGYTWEIDEFISPKVPTVAEIELISSHHDYPLPEFIGEEVTGNPAYYNSNI